MFTSILSLVLGALPAVLRQIMQARVDLANSKTEQEKIAANERIKALEARRDILIKEAETPWNNIARFLFVTPVALYWSWTIVWDKLLCPDNCSTDPLADWQMNIFWTILGFYFLTDLTKLWKR
jgi:hypothetical protein